MGREEKTSKTRSEKIDERLTFDKIEREGARDGQGIRASETVRETAETRDRKDRDRRIDRGESER